MNDEENLHDSGSASDIPPSETKVHGLLKRFGLAFDEVPQELSDLAKKMYRQHGPRGRKTPNRLKRGNWRLKMRQYERRGRQE